MRDDYLHDTLLACIACGAEICYDAYLAEQELGWECYDGTDWHCPHCIFIHDFYY